MLYAKADSDGITGQSCSGEQNLGTRLTDEENKLEETARFQGVRKGPKLPFWQLADG